MNGPQTWRQGAQLNALHAALFYKSNRILKIVVRVLRAVRSKNSARQHRFAIDGFDNAHFVCANLNQRHLSNYSLKRVLDQMQSRFEHVCLNSYFAFCGNYTSGRHLGAEIAALFDRNLARIDVDRNPFEDDDQHNEDSQSYQQD